MNNRIVVLTHSEIVAIAGAGVDAVLVDFFNEYGPIMFFVISILQFLDNCCKIGFAETMDKASLWCW